MHLIRPVFPALTAALVLGMALALPARADEITPSSSRLSAVTVYPGGATVTRLVDISVPAGRHDITLADLPAAIDTGSLTISLSGPDGLMLGAIGTDRVPVAQVVSPREKELTEQLEKAATDLKVLEAKRNVLSAKLRFIEGRGQNEAVDRASMEFLWGLLNTDAEKLSTATVAQDKLVADAREEVDRLQRALDEIRTGKRDQTIASIDVTARQAATARLTVQYFVHNASWQPRYIARLNTDARNIDLTRSAVVRQNSGEDWQNVDLTLSTAAPRRQAGPPPLSTWWIAAQPPTMKARSLSKMATAEMADAQMAAAPPPMAAQLIETPFTAAFAVTGASSVASNNSEQDVPLDRHSLSTKLAVTVHARRDPTAYLTARTVLPADLHFLPGAVTLYRDGTLVGRDHWRQTGAQEQTFSFGEDRRVRVDRRLLADREGDKGFFNREDRLERRYAISLTSDHADAVPVEVVEQLPVSRDEDVKVSLLKDSTAGYEREDNPVPGTVRWSFDLKPSETRDILFAYGVTYPPGQRPNGL